MATVTSTPLSVYRSPGSAYKKAIADYVQTDRHGNWMDLHFKVVSMETEDCTVADSIAILYEDSRKEQAIAIESEKQNLAYWQSKIEQFKRGSVNPRLKDTYRENVVLSKYRLESLENMKLIEPVHYQGMDADQLLAVYVTCTYTINQPDSNAYQKRTDRFVLTLDGSTVLGKQKKSSGNTLK